MLLNSEYYITKQIIPALNRVFGLVGAGSPSLVSSIAYFADLEAWWASLPRIKTGGFAMPNESRDSIFATNSGQCECCGEESLDSSK
jgi:hypothetical protein